MNFRFVCHECGWALDRCGCSGGFDLGLTVSPDNRVVQEVRGRKGELPAPDCWLGPAPGRRRPELSDREMKRIRQREARR